MNDREKTAIRLLVEYRQEARKLGWGCDSLDAEATRVIDSALVDSEYPPAAAAARIAAAAPRMLEALKVMREAAERLEGWRDLDGTAIDSIIASDLTHEADCALRQAGAPWTRRHRVSVTVEVTLDTTPGEASEPGNVIMAAVEAVRDGEGTVVAHEIVK